MAYRSFSCLQTGIRINSCCLSMGSMLKPEAPRFFSSFRRFTAAVQNGRIGSKIRKMNRPSVIRARGHMVSLYPYRHRILSRKSEDFLYFHTFSPQSERSNKRKEKKREPSSAARYPYGRTAAQERAAADTTTSRRLSAEVEALKQKPSRHQPSFRAGI